MYQNLLLIKTAQQNEKMGAIANADDD